jgi:hypothetical protein
MSETDTCRLREIDFRDRSFPFSYGPPPERLAQSLAAVGLLTPPRLQPGENGLVIVSGRRRLEILRRLAGAAWPEREVIFQPAGDRPMSELFLEAAWENLALREFNPVESAEIVLRALELFPLERLRRELLPALKIPGKPRFFERCRVIAGFPEELRRLVASGRLDGESIDILGRWQPDEVAGLSVFPVITALKRNLWREVIGRVDDLARRDRISPLKVLESAVDAAGGPEEGDPVAGIRRFLEAQLYPNLTAARQNFARLREQLDLPPEVAIEPPPAFEGGDFRLSFTFTGAEEWHAVCRRLGAVAPEAIDELCRRP